MPSGSHGGSSGSHSSGGSSFGGGGSSFGGSGRSSPPSPMHFRWRGNSYYISGGKASTIRFFFVFGVFLLFFGLACVASFFSAKETIQKIVTDQAYYINMIEYAEEHPEYQKEGEITGRFYNEDVDRWYITYSLPTMAGGILKGYTFSVYSTEDMKKPEFQVGQPLTLAVDNPNVNILTDSINMEYKNIPLENDGEYLQAIRSRNSSIIIACVFGAVAITLIVVGFVKIKKEAQNEAELGKVTAGNSVLGNNGSSQKANEQKPRHCVYCGNYVSDEDKKCPSCGSRKFKK